jgi:hypothetical protein
MTYATTMPRVTREVDFGMVIPGAVAHAAKRKIAFRTACRLSIASSPE